MREYASITPVYELAALLEKLTILTAGTYALSNSVLQKLGTFYGDTGGAIQIYEESLAIALGTTTISFRHP